MAGAWDWLRKAGDTEREDGISHERRVRQLQMGDGVAILSTARVYRFPLAASPRSLSPFHAILLPLPPSHLAARSAAYPPIPRLPVKRRRPHHPPPPRARCAPPRSLSSFSCPPRSLYTSYGPFSCSSSARPALRSAIFLGLRRPRSSWAICARCMTRRTRASLRAGRPRTALPLSIAASLAAADS